MERGGGLERGVHGHQRFEKMFHHGNTPRLAQQTLSAGLGEVCNVGVVGGKAENSALLTFGDFG